MTKIINIQDYLYDLFTLMGKAKHKTVDEVVNDLLVEVVQKSIVEAISENK